MQARQSKPLRCGNPLVPLSSHVTRFRCEWVGVLQAIAQARPLVANSCDALLKLDPLSTKSDAAIEAHIARIRPMLSDPALARRMYRERDRVAFGKGLMALRKALGWSVRRLARECIKVARRMGFGVHAPDRHQLMDYEAGRSNAQPRTKVVLAAAFGVAVDQLEVAPS